MKIIIYFHSSNYRKTVAQTVGHGASNTNFMGSIPREFIGSIVQIFNAMQVVFDKN